MSNDAMNKLQARVESAKQALGDSYILSPKYQPRKPYPLTESRILAPVLAKARKAGRI